VYFCDGLEHIPPWFKHQLQLAQQATWFVHQLPLHPKMKFGLIHKISTSAQNHNKKNQLILHYFLRQAPDIQGTR
jgi:uncharacterized phage-like protein YoqJ